MHESIDSSEITQLRLEYVKATGQDSTSQEKHDAETKRMRKDPN